MTLKRPVPGSNAARFNALYNAYGGGVMMDDSAHIKKFYGGKFNVRGIR